MEKLNHSKDAAIDLKSLANSMREDVIMNKRRQPSSRFTICKVPEHIRKDDSGAYDPKIVSIGPFHRGRENLKAMEERKWNYFYKLLYPAKDDYVDPKVLVVYLTEMKDIEPQVRSSYSGSIIIDRMTIEDFLKMMVLDGLFVIQILLQQKGTDRFDGDDPIHQNNWMLSLIGHDMLLLENQLPFFVLELLWSLIVKQQEDLKKLDLKKLALGFFGHLLPDDAQSKPAPQLVNHLLHLTHNAFKPAFAAQDSSSDTTAKAKTPTTSPGSTTPPGQQSTHNELMRISSGEQSSGAFYSSMMGAAPTWGTDVRMSPVPSIQKPSPEAHCLKYQKEGAAPTWGPSPVVTCEEIWASPQDGLEVVTTTCAPTCPSPQAGQQLSPRAENPQKFKLIPEPNQKNKNDSSKYSGTSYDPRRMGHRRPPTPPGQQLARELESGRTPSGQQFLLAEVMTEFICASTMSAIPSPTGKVPPQSETDSIPSATELLEAGVTFLKKEASSFLDVTFKDGKMEMPRLKVSDTANLFFRNYIAFEQCFPECGSHFTSYCFFIDKLVNTAKDVGILHQREVIENLLGSDKEVALLFNKLCSGIFIDFEHGSYLTDLFKQVNKYTKQWWPTQRASLVRDYFNNPWSALSVAAAIVVIVLTAVQTFFSVFAYVKPPES